MIVPKWRYVGIAAAVLVCCKAVPKRLRADIAVRDPRSTLNTSNIPSNHEPDAFLTLRRVINVMAARTAAPGQHCAGTGGRAQGADGG